MQRLLLIFTVLLSPTAAAQVHYHPDGNPWKQRASSGPDAEAPGWYYNLGPTGLRVELVEEEPTVLVVRHVLPDSPAARRVEVGDRIVGAGGREFETPHRNGYGMAVFGPTGPIEDFASALEASYGREAKGRLELELRREGERRSLSLKLGVRQPAFGEGFPADCQRSTEWREGLYEYLLEHQGDDGSWGAPPRDTFAPLALLASGERKYLKAVEKNARWHARTTKAEDSSSLINWRYQAAGIVLSEYYLATKARWVLPELQEVYDFLISSQYLSLEQVDPRVRETHPDSWPRDADDSHGGWGHNPGFEGYGPISMLTGQGALALALMARCGIEVDRTRHDAAYAFLERASGRNGYVWYGDEAAGQDDWADMGRTGAAALANWASPYEEPRYHARARRHSRIIGAHPLSYPDTHASPILGMGWAAAAAWHEPAAFRSLMEANRWWFALAECPDGSFYYQPNRDNAGYGPRSRLAASAVTAFVLSIPAGRLALLERAD